MLPWIQYWTVHHSEQGETWTDPAVKHDTQTNLTIALTDSGLS